MLWTLGNYPDVAIPETQHLTVNGAEFRFFYDCYNGRRGVVLEKAQRASYRREAVLCPERSHH